MYYLFFKRVFDLLFSVLVIAGVLSWVLPLLALLIRLDSPGPVFFLQKRVGKGGKTFTCIKMRTMITNQLADKLPASRDDKRITRVGWWLRGSHLDELPQFFNVFIGSLRLSGARTYILAESHGFSQLAPDHPVMKKVKTGVTEAGQGQRVRNPLTSAAPALVVF